MIGKERDSKISELERRIVKVRLEDLTVDYDCYPRSYVKSEIVRRYAEAMEAGEVFPPMAVLPDLNEGDSVKYIILDGVHRFHALKLIKGLDETVDVEVIVGGNFSIGDRIALAVEFNLRHGQAFDSSDIDKIRQLTGRDGDISAWASDWQRLICYKELFASVEDSIVEKVQAALHRDTIEGEDEVEILYKFAAQEIFGEKQPEFSALQTLDTSELDFQEIQEGKRGEKSPALEEKMSPKEVPTLPEPKKDSVRPKMEGKTRQGLKKTLKIDDIKKKLDEVMEQILVASREEKNHNPDKLFEIAWTLFYYAFRYHRKFMVEVFHSRKDFDAFVSAAFEYINSSHLPDIVKVKTTTSLREICN